MSRRNNILATFERKAEIDDYFAGERDSWVEVCKAWVSLDTGGVPTQGGERVDSDQTRYTRRYVVKTYCTTEAKEITTDCRMKWEKESLPVPEEPNNDANFRIFHLDKSVNIREQNRELQMVAIEEP